MSVFLSYILLGLSLAAPIGPINAAQIEKGIRSGFMHSWLIGVGAMAADIVYMLIVYIGVVKFIDTPFMKTFLLFFGCFILIYTGIETLLKASDVTLDRTKKSEPLFRSFLAGFFMSISNPLTILFWLGIYGSVLAETASAYGHRQLMIYSTAIIIGLLIWDIAMASIASSFKRFLTSGLILFISVISGLSLIGFGIYFGIEAIKVLV